MSDQSVKICDISAIFMGPGTMASGIPSLFAISFDVNLEGVISFSLIETNSITSLSVTDFFIGPISSPISTS